VDDAWLENLPTAQRDQLCQVLTAAATAPGNRSRFLAAGLIRSDGSTLLAPDWLTAFRRLVPLDSARVRRSPSSFLARFQTPIAYRGATSGTESQSYTYFADQDWNQQRIAARQRALARWGIDDQIPIVNVASRLLPVRSVDMALVGPIDHRLVDRLRDQVGRSPVVLRGYPSRLCEVAHLLESGELPGLVAVICTGETLYAHQAQWLQRRLQAPVVNEYGCQETGISGLTCPEANRLHLDGDRCLYEVFQEQLVTTDLWNRVMPLVRYRCGDRLRFDSAPCPCGRLGPTAQILGRDAEQIRTVKGWQLTGAISVPALPRIATYQVVRHLDRNLDLWIQPDPGVALPDFQPLQSWARDLFGDLPTRLWLEQPNESISAQAERGTIVNAARSSSQADWIKQVSQGPWAEWLAQPLETCLPNGEAQPAAALLQELVDPQIFCWVGMAEGTRSRLQALQAREPPLDPEAAWITARILLFASASLAPGEDVAPLYHLARERLQRAIVQAGLRSDWMTQSLGDRLIPTLLLDTATAQSIWAEVWKTHQHWSDPYPLDTFQVQMLLYTFESAVQRWANSPRVQALRPYLTVLIGDLRRSAPRFNLRWLAHWCEILHNQLMLPDQAFETSDSCLKQRGQWLRSPAGVPLLEPNYADRGAVSDEGQCWLEAAYGQLLREQPLDMDLWRLRLLTLGFLDATQPARNCDPIAWMPICWALAQPLVHAGDLDLAYRCLCHVAPPHSRRSAFERLAVGINDKQAVLVDLACEYSQDGC